MVSLLVCKLEVQLRRSAITRYTCNYLKSQCTGILPIAILREIPV